MTMAQAADAPDKPMAKPATEESPLLPNVTNLEDGPAGNENGFLNTKWPGEADFEGVPWWKKPSVYWLLPAYAIYAIAFGGIIVPKLNLVLNLICRDYLTDRAVVDPTFTFTPVIPSEDNPQCHTTDITALASKFMLYVGLIASILAAITSPKIGALSDRYGRKPLLVLTTFGGLISEVVTILAAKFPDHISYRWLLAGAVAEGLCGSFIASSAMTHSYATDCTPPAKRAIAFGYFHGCLFVGIAVGPILAAVIIEKTETIVTVFYFALVVHLFFTCVILLVPESLSAKRQVAAREKFNLEARESSSSSRWNLKRFNVLAPLKILYPTGEGSSSQLRMNLLLLSAVDTILFGSAMASITIVVYYAEYKFEWDTKEANFFLSAANISRVTGLVVVLPLLNYIFRTRHKNKVRRESGIELLDRNSGSDNLDLWSIRVSILIEIIGYGGYALAQISPVFVMSAIVASFGGIGSPTLQSALTKHVPHDRTGQLLGATGLLHALARIIWPTAITMIFTSTVKTFPQTVFFVLVGCFVIALICSLFIKPHIYLEDIGIIPSRRRQPSREEEAASEQIADEEATAI